MIYFVSNFDLMFKIICIWLISLIWFNNLNAQYADLGNGALKQQIWWLDWSGFTISNGASKTFNLDDGLSVVITFSGVTQQIPTPDNMNTWYGATLHNLYDFSNTSIKPALHSSNNPNNSQFSMSIAATRNGLPTEFTFIAADAEASATTEISTLTTSGTNWTTLEFFRNSSQTSNPVTGCGTQTALISDTYGGSTSVGQNALLATKASVTIGQISIAINLNKSGVFGGMAMAFGIMAPVDRGDLPSSYGYAMHKLSFINSNGCNIATPLPNVTVVQSLRIGVNGGDADGTQSVDDNINGIDEDGLTTPFPNYSSNGSYTLNIPVTNTTGANAFLTGYFDYNRNGVFDIGESVTATVANNATSVALTWNGLPNILPIGSVPNYGFRFRLSSNLSATQVAIGLAPDGEVEDYFVPINVSSQAAFSSPDTVCVNTPLTITNQSSGASSYYWNFCLANANSMPIGSNLGNIGGQFLSPVFMDVVKENGNYYGFVTNNYPGKLTRLDFGNSLLNNPVAVNLGNVGGIVPDAAEGIQVVKTGGVWYAIIVGGASTIPGGSRIVKIDFGTNITNINPTGVNWGNLGNLDYPTDLHVFNDNGNWYGLTVSFNNQTITRFNFGANFSSAPVATNLGNIGNLNRPCGINAVFSNNKWYVFITNRDGNSLSRLDFGSSLLNNPVGINLGNPSGTFNQPRDFYILNFCGNLVGYLVNEGSSDLVRLNFGLGIESVPAAISLGNIGSMNFPSSISSLFRVGADLFSFVLNVNNNTLSRLKFTGCTNSNIPNSTLQNPPVISYNTPGIYNINLMMDEGLSTQSSYCKQVVVIAQPTHTQTQNISFCDGDSIVLSSNVANATYLWNTGATTRSIKVAVASTFWVTSTIGASCSVRDSIITALRPKPAIFAGLDASVCSPDSVSLNASGVGDFSWNPSTSLSNPLIYNPKASPGVTTDYVVTLIAANGCSAKDTIKITVNPKPTITKSADADVCKDSQVQLSASATNAASYSWTPISGLNNPLIYNPIATAVANITYTVTITASNGCFKQDSIKITVRPRPTVSVRSDTIVCYNVPVTLTSNNIGATTVSWLPVAGLSNPTIPNPIATPVTTTRYLITATNAVGCSDTASMLLTIKPSPVITKSANANICTDSIVQIFALSPTANSYSWLPVTGLSNSSIGNPLANPAITTNYVVTVNGTNGCVGKDSVLVSVFAKPTVMVRIDTSVCYNTPIVLSTQSSNATGFSWLPTVGLSNPLIANPVATPLAPQQYIVTASNANCSVKDTINLGVLALPVIHKSLDTTICKTGFATLTVSGGANYVWSPAYNISSTTGNLVSVNPDTTLFYKVLVTASNNCTNIDSIKVTVNPKPVFALQPIAAKICKTDSIELTASGGDVYKWIPAYNIVNPNSAITKVFPTVSTIYKVAITNTTCKQTDTLRSTITINSLPATAITKSNDITCTTNDSRLLITGGVSYLWNIADGITELDVPNPLVKPFQTTTYIVKVTGSNGCFTYDSIKVNVNYAGSNGLYLMPNAFSPNKDNLNDCFGLKYWGGITELDFTIYNRFGQIVFHTTNITDCWDGKFKGIDADFGTYVYQIKAKTICNGDVYRKGTFILLR